MPEELKEEAKELLKRIGDALEGLLLETKNDEIRRMGTAQFTIDELRRLRGELERFISRMDVQ